jgi:hypothetical protein
VSLCLEVHRDSGRRVSFWHGEFAGRSFPRGQYEYGGNDRIFGSERSYVPRSPPCGTRSPLRRRVGVPLRSDRMYFSTSPLSKWHDIGLIHFVLTQVLSRLLTLAPVFYFQARWRAFG